MERDRIEWMVRSFLDERLFNIFRISFSYNKFPESEIVSDTGSLYNMYK